MLISIAMAVRNSAQFLPDALSSIAPALAGSGGDFEIVAADGASTDETVAILQANPKARLVSRSDAGIYDGMNRALDAAHGDFVLLLNGDDEMAPGAFGRAAGLLNRAPEAAFASGDAAFGRSGESYTVRRHRGPLSAQGALFGIPAINARLFRTDAIRRLGPLLIDAGLGSDREYLLRAHTAGLKGIAVGETTYRYRSHAGSETIAGDVAGRARVYRAEMQLAARLAETYASDQEITRLARAAHSLGSVKLRAAGQKTPASSGDLSGLVDLARAVPLALRWRGILSGF